MVQIRAGCEAQQAQVRDDQRPRPSKAMVPPPPVSIFYSVGSGARRALLPPQRLECVRRA